PKPLTLNDILSKLTFTSRVDKTVAQINAKLIEQIEERKVGFELTKDDEQKITKRGGNPALIKAVKTNFLETRSPEESDLELFLKLWDCNSKTDLASRKKCLSIANKLARYFEEDPSTARDYNELKSYAQKMDELIKTAGMKKNAAVENFPNPALPTIIEQSVLYNRFVACYAKTDVESQKSCVKIAKEFLTKYENDPEVKEQIEYFRAYIPRMEEFIKRRDTPCNWGSRFTELNNLYKKIIDCSKKTDLESRKSCVAFAKEFIKKAEAENISGKEIDEVKQFIQLTEKRIEEMSKDQ
ncbi:MAG TPA: hypothetical protein PKY59_24060, partial [Pyrinomonadaceae bacterium]|nr:hypothetical protein [Pyrinomonadaceae bacterium]